MIEFSCHTWAFNDLPLPEALGTVARLGFRYVDLGSGTHFNLARAASDPRRAVNEMIGYLRLFNLKLADFYLMLPRISLADEDKRRKDIDLFKSLVPFIQAIGTPGITLSPGLAHASDDSAAYQRTTAALCEMVQAVGEDLAVSIEPHLDSMVETPETALRLIEDVPGLSLTLDCSHFICQGFSHEDIVCLLPHTRHLHLRQAAKKKVQTSFAEGKIDLRKVLQSLMEVRYSGVICIEHMKNPGWHGAMDINILRETSKLRDMAREALREFQQKA